MTTASPLTTEIQPTELDCYREAREALRNHEPRTLCAGWFVTEEGQHCALGVVAKARGWDGSWDSGSSAGNFVYRAHEFGFHSAIAEENNKGRDETPERRYARVCRWLDKQIKSLESKAGVR